MSEKEKKEKKRILLVEDDPLIVDIYTTKLEESGFEVKAVSDGQEALDRIKREDFDLMVLEIVLPRLTGFDLLKKMKKEKLKKLKILVLSALGQDSNVKLAKKLGAKKYLIKSHFTPSETVEEIKAILKE